jgi:hypothetical protein
MTVAEMACRTGLDWKTVKKIAPLYLEQDYGQPDLNGLKILDADEISIRNGHSYSNPQVNDLVSHIVPDATT